jgi:hypothetical protein
MFIKKSMYEEMVGKISRLENKLNMIPELKRKYTIVFDDKTVVHVGTDYSVYENGVIICDGQKLVARYFKQPKSIVGEDD